MIAEEVFEADLPLPNVASMQTRPARQDRPEVDLRRLVVGLPAHGARHRRRRRGPRPGGAAAAAHPVVGREGLHHHPRRLGPPGPHPAALHLPAGRHVERAADVGPQRAGERGHRHRRALQPGRRAGAGHRGGGRGGPAGRAGRHAVHRHRAVHPAHGRRAADLDRQPPGAGGPGPGRGRLRRALAARRRRRPPGPSGRRPPAAGRRAGSSPGPPPAGRPPAMGASPRSGRRDA